MVMRISVLSFSSRSSVITRAVKSGAEVRPLDCPAWGVCVEMRV